MRADFRAAFATRSRDQWVEELAPADTCVAPVYSVPELVEDDHYRARGVIAEAHHATQGSFAQLGTILAGTDTSRRTFEVPDAAVTDTDAVLRAAGLTDERVRELREQGAIA